MFYVYRYCKIKKSEKATGSNLGADQKENLNSCKITCNRHHYQIYRYFSQIYHYSVQLLFCDYIFRYMTSKKAMQIS